MPLPAFILVLIAGIWLAVIWLAVRPPTDRNVSAVAGLYGVTLTDATVPLLRDAIGWTRRFRVGGAVLMSIAAIVTGLADSFNLLAIAGGVAAGSLVAELTRPQQFDRSRRQATLDRRGITDFIEGFVLVIMAVAAIALAVGTMLAVTLDGTARLPSDRWFATTTAIALTVALASVVLARSIARQPAPVGDHAHMAVRHAIRAASISSVLGGGFIALGVGMYRVTGNTVMEDSAASVFVRHGNNAVYFAMIATLAAGLALTFNSLPRANRSVRPEATVGAGAS